MGSALVLLVAGCIGSAPADVESPGVPPSPEPGAANTLDRFWNAPFEGAPRLGNYFDHDIPLQGVDENGRVLNWQGESVRGIDGHSGYDWPLPEGTPLRAVADGVVIYSQADGAFYCRHLERNVTGQLRVIVAHDSPSGHVYMSHYVHNSENLVRVGDVVSQGNLVANSGNTGCSTGPHLHFEVRSYEKSLPPAGGIVGVLDRVDLLGVPVDPYGWEGSGVDPWSADARGAPSRWLWLAGRAPPLWP